MTASAASTRLVYSSRPRPLPALSREAYDELKALLVLAVRETRGIGATRNLLKTLAKEIVAAHLAGQVERLVDDEIDRYVRSGLLVIEAYGAVQLAKSLRDNNE